MKVRVIQKNENDFIPQWFNYEKHKWETIYLRDDFGVEYYYTLEEAQEACKEFVKKEENKGGTVVWTEDL